MSDNMELRCENCSEMNTALDIEMSVYCHRCGRMLPIERYYENLGTAEQPKWGRPLWRAEIEDAAHAAGVAAERARVVAVAEKALQDERNGDNGGDPEVEHALYRVLSKVRAQ